MPFHGEVWIHVVKRSVDGLAEVLRMKDLTLEDSAPVKIVSPFPTLSVRTEVEEVAARSEGNLSLVRRGIDGMNALGGLEGEFANGTLAGLGKGGGKQIVIVRLEMTLPNSTLPHIFFLFGKRTPGTIGRKIKAIGKIVIGGIVLVKSGIHVWTEINVIPPFSVFALERKPKIETTQTTFAIRGEVKNLAIGT